MKRRHVDSTRPVKDGLPLVSQCGQLENVVGMLSSYLHTAKK